MHSVPVRRFFVFNFIASAWRIITTVALQSVPRPTPLSSQSTPEHINEQHPSGRRWKRRRRQQIFLPSPRRNISAPEEVALVEQLSYLPPNICCVSARSGDCGSLSLSDSKHNAEDDRIDTTSRGIGRPIAIQSYPLLIQQIRHEKSDNNQDSSTKYVNCNITPFPTIYWLCDPHVSRAISELERQGYVRIFQSRLEDNLSIAKEWLQCHECYALERWDLLSDQDREWLLQNVVADEVEPCATGSMRDMVQYSGVAGTDSKGQKQPETQASSLFIPSVKCLHSHYAHYRSQLHQLETKQEGLGGGEKNNAILNVIGLWTHDLLAAKFPDIIL